MRRVAIIASAGGNGKTTLGRALAAHPVTRLRTTEEVERWMANV